MTEHSVPGRGSRKAPAEYIRDEAKTATQPRKEEKEIYDEGLREDAVRLLREASERQGEEQGMAWVVPKSVSHHAGIEYGSPRYEQVVAYMEGEGWIRCLNEGARLMAGAPIYHLTSEGFDALREGESPTAQVGPEVRKS